MSEDGRIVSGTLSLSPASHGAKNEDTTQKGGGVSDFYGELSEDCKSSETYWTPREVKIRSPGEADLYSQLL